METANRAQETNTKNFLAAFGRLTREVQDLSNQVTSEKLRSKLLQVQSELEKTQKALAPGPKAELSFTFFPFFNPPVGQPIALVTEKTLPINADGTVHVEFDIINATDVDALDIEANFQICDECRYAKEPEEMTRIPGLTEKQRYLYIRILSAKMAYKTLSVDVIPPSNVQAFLVGIQYRCHTCVIRQQPSELTVRLSR